MKKSEEAPDPEIIKSTRQTLGLTQRECAEIIHSGIRAWQNWEQGNRIMPYASWQYFLRVTMNRMPWKSRMSTGIGLPDAIHPCASPVRSAWEQSHNLEDARQALANCLRAHHVDPFVANYALAAQLADVPRFEPTPDELAATVKHLMENGSNLLEIGEWLMIWGG